MESKVILFFDGECLFCNMTVQWILKNEKDKILFFSPLQSGFAQELIPPDLKKMDSVILLKNNTFYTHFTAFIEILPYLKWYWKWLYVLKLLPRPLQIKLYNWIARNRKKWFGRTNTCSIKNSNDSKRLIE
jgi:predicted DCC family thiol-disulfide oxidoreductase YuxK